MQMGRSAQRYLLQHFEWGNKLPEKMEVVSVKLQENAKRNRVVASGVENKFG